MESFDCAWNTGDLNSVETYLDNGSKFQVQISYLEENWIELINLFQKTVIHSGTWVSALNVIANMQELKSIRAQLFPRPLPEPKFQIRRRFQWQYSITCSFWSMRTLFFRHLLHYSKIVDGWCLPFLGSDKSVVERGEVFFFEQNGSRPIQIKTYAKQESILFSLLMILAFLFIAVMAQFKFTRCLLTKVNSPITHQYYANFMHVVLILCII